MPASATFCGAAADDALEHLQRQRVAREIDDVQGEDRPRAHGVDVAERVGRGDAAPQVGVVDDGRDVVDRGDQRQVVGQAGRRPRRRPGRARRARAASIDGREVAQHLRQLSLAELARSTGAVAEAGQARIARVQRLHCITSFLTVRVHRWVGQRSFAPSQPHPLLDEHGREDDGKQPDRRSSSWATVAPKLSPALSIGLRQRGDRGQGHASALCTIRPRCDSGSSTSTSCRGRGPDGAEEQLLRDALEQVELADRVGFDDVWEVEHHFLEEYSHSSAPEVFLAAASQRTKRIRLGHGIVQLPPGFNHPARVAERIATLDLISGGRVEFGTGESCSQAELGGFGVEREPEARAVGGVARRDHAHVRRGAVRRATRAGSCDAAAQRGAEADAEAASAAVGGVQPARDDPAWRRARASARCRSRSSSRRRRKEWVDEYYRLLAVGRVRARGVRRQPERGRGAAVHVPRGRADRDRARHRRRALLRLLAGALLRVRQAPARADQRVGGVPARTATDYGFAREIVQRRTTRRSG